MRSVAVRVAAVVAALGAAAAASACQHPSPGPSAQPPTDTAVVSAPDHDAADVAFLQNMLAHHQQGIAVSAMAAGRTGSAQLAAFAQRITSEQRTELDGFRAQLMQWEEPLAPSSGTTPDGMVDQGTLDKLQTLRGADFDKLWLQTLIAHHRGAISMARTEIASGQSPDIISIAKSVAASQQAQIDEMNQMLGS